MTPSLVLYETCLINLSSHQASAQTYSSLSFSQSRLLEIQTGQSGALLTCKTFDGIVDGEKF